VKPRRPVEKPIAGFDPAPSTAISTFFGIGFFPHAPATVASLVVGLLLLAAGEWGIGPRLILLLLASAGGTWAAGRTEQRYGHDARCIVIDEVAGMLVSTLLIPWDPIPLALAFLFFRVFDILKPPPGYQLEALPGGVGIMADDLMAGIYSLLLLLLVGVLVPSF